VAKRVDQANRRAAAPPVGVRARQGKTVAQKGLLEAKDTPRRSIKPDLQDFNEVKMNYCRKHNITIAELSARLEDDDQLRAELYRLALAAELIGLRPTGQDDSNSRITHDREYNRHRRSA
jgi:hypothetical protein